MKGITKRFGDVLANDQVDLQIPSGKIHAIVGENGAGKSTIMKILYGFYQATEGTIWINGKQVNIQNPHDAINNGIGMVHQHFMLIPPLSVTENIILGVENPGFGGWLSKSGSINKIKKLSNEYSLHIDPEETVENLSVGQQQRVEILKALYREVDILILDEPTAVLTPLEVEEFFNILKLLKNQGKTIIIITHKLEEVLAISDQVTVMRNGKKMGDLPTSEATASKLATMMVGREVLLRVEKEKAVLGEQLLKLENLNVVEGGQLHLDHFNLELHAGEIVGIAGVEGNGQTELVYALTGLLSLSEGKITYKGQDITNLDARKTREKSIGHIPADRLEHGFIKTFSNKDNLILGFHYREPFCSNSGWMNFKVIEENAAHLIQEYNVQPPSLLKETGQLSGGNQQKLIVAREFSRQPDLLVIAQPTRGVDIGAIEFIHQKIIDLRDQGTAVLLISAELEEIQSLSDRAIVMFEGKNVGEIDLENFDKKEVGLMMTGGS